MSAQILDLNQGILKRKLKMTLKKEMKRKPCRHEKRELYTPWGWMCVKCLDEWRRVR